MKKEEHIADLKTIIQAYKQKTGATDAQIARIVDVDRSTVARWSSGSIRKISGTTMQRVSAMVGYNIAPLMKGMDISIQLPVLGYVKAGYDLFAEENYLGMEEASLLEAKKGDYYLKVEGDSMIGAGILDGSLVLVRQCSSLENGKIGVILIGEEVTVKRVRYQHHMMILEAANPAVPNRYFTHQEIESIPIRILGQVVSCKTYF